MDDDQQTNGQNRDLHLESSYSCIIRPVKIGFIFGPIYSSLEILMLI